ncbi:MAG: methyltransferase domain-containing protein [Pseudomonadota bacterium]
MGQSVIPKTDQASSDTGKKAPFTFFLEFLRHPMEIGSVIPSSAFLERRILAAADLENAAVVVELGCGTGGTTQALLEGMTADGRLLAVDVNERFTQLVSNIPDSRLIAQLGSATDIGQILKAHGFENADVVVSGIPFSTMPWDLGESIVKAIHACLKPGGRFVAYQASRRVQKLSEPVFGRGSESLELINVPPMRVHRWIKTV